MAKQNNRTCIICGKQYHYCPICGSDSNKPSWYFLFNDENCYDIYDVCVSYRDKVIDIEEAYEKVSKLDLTNLENFAEPTKLQIKEIMNYKNNTKPTSVTTENKATKTEILSKTNNIKK